MIPWALGPFGSGPIWAQAPFGARAHLNDKWLWHVVVSAGAKKVYFPDFSKDMFLKSKMKHVVKYDVYLDVLLMVFIYVTKY